MDLICTPPTNSDDKETYFQHAGQKGFNLLHLNVLYDLTNKLYLDALLQPRRSVNELRALADLVDCSCIHEKAILIADRGYENYNSGVVQ